MPINASDPIIFNNMTSLMHTFVLEHLESYVLYCLQPITPIHFPVAQFIDVPEFATFTAASKVQTSIRITSRLSLADFLGHEQGGDRWIACHYVSLVILASLAICS